MELKITNSSEFVNGFIGGLARISDTGIIKLSNKKFSCITATSDNTIVVNSEYIDDTLPEELNLTLNIPDFKKLQKLLSILPSNFVLNIDSNSIGYNSEGTRFKFHLYEEGIISSPALNVGKINSIPFDYKFHVLTEDIRWLMKSSFLLPDITKVYFNFTDTKVHGEITDKSRHNVDSYTKLLCDNAEVIGELITRSVPINIEILRLLTAVSYESLLVRYSKNLSILTFDIKQTNLHMKYIVSGLIN